ncbi:MAG TPA: hypothetical protein VN719_09500 [Gemmatimonadales bacterium]|nr:hypothetical protein [Gemmatimonadales bacterium]
MLNLPRTAATGKPRRMKDVFELNRERDACEPEDLDYRLSPSGLALAQREERLRELTDRARVAHTAMDRRWTWTKRWSRKQVLDTRRRALLVRWTRLAYHLHRAEEMEVSFG